MPLIEVNGVSKVFWRHTGRKLLRQQIADMLRPRREEEYFHALRDVSFSVGRGEGVALIGGNGAGKSTMLSLVSGLALPTKGSVKVHGTVAALLELGSGFHLDLTGEENVFVNAALMGYSERDAKARFDEIVDFSGIGDFINEPMRTYSSGMLVRLAFAIAVHADPAILIVDEILAVGDIQYQEKCLRKVSELRKRNTTLLCVSHSSKMVIEFCDRAIWLHQGRVALDGDSTQVMQAYSRYVTSSQGGLACDVPGVEHTPVR
jgi:lipopolysaccharide transport system ATP-binding protein